MVTIAPVPAIAGEKELMAGLGTNVNPPMVAVAVGDDTFRFPDAPEPTMASMLVEEITVNESTGTPPKLTDVIPVKPFPEIVTSTPGPANAGEKEYIANG